MEPHEPHEYGSASSLAKGEEQLHLLSLQDGTLCSFCDQVCNKQIDGPHPFRLRPLTDLLQASSSCKYCAMWVRTLEASAQDVVEDGNGAAIVQHPLLQDVFEPEHVVLQYLEGFNWPDDSIEQRIAWPQSGVIWGTLDLVPAKGQLP